MPPPKNDVKGATAAPAALKATLMGALMALMAITNGEGSTSKPAAKQGGGSSKRKAAATAGDEAKDANGGTSKDKKGKGRAVEEQLPAHEAEDMNDTSSDSDDDYAAGGFTEGNLGGSGKRFLRLVWLTEKAYRDFADIKKGDDIGLKAAFQNVNVNMLPYLPTGDKAMTKMNADWADPPEWGELPASLRGQLDHVRVHNPGPHFTQLLPEYPRHQILLCPIAGISPAVLEHMRTLGKQAAQQAGYVFEDLTTTRVYYSWPKGKFFANGDSTVYYLKNFQPLMALIRPLSQAASYGVNAQGKHLMMFKSFPDCRDFHELLVALRINTKGHIPTPDEDIKDENAANTRAKALNAANARENAADAA